jgi:hypothetical protein
MSSLENASLQYKEHNDYASLDIIYKSLSKGKQRKEVESLLGEPDYSPIDGQHYYSSDHSEYSQDQARDVTVGLVVDYRDGNGEITDKLQEFWMVPIAE